MNAEAEQPEPRLIHARCPQCGAMTTLTYIGEQHWPKEVAAKRGVKSVSLWTCSTCGTTVDGAHLR